MPLEKCDRGAVLFHVSNEIDLQCITEEGLLVFTGVYWCFTLIHAGVRGRPPSLPRRSFFYELGPSLKSSFV